MRRSLCRRTTYFDCFVALLLNLFLSCIALGEGANCTQIDEVFGIAEWRTLATGEFVELQRDQYKIQSRASAKILLKGYAQCRIFIGQLLSTNEEEASYDCRAPQSTAQGQDHLIAVKAVTAQWQSCFVGWEESSDFVKALGMAMGSVEFKKGNRRALFTRSNIESNSEPVIISLIRTVKK